MSLNEKSAALMCVAIEGREAEVCLTKLQAGKFSFKNGVMFIC